MTDPTPTVLVVEDERDLADLYTEWLENEFVVKTCYDGEAAIKGLDSSIDVVLLDRRMPGISGDEVLEVIRSNDIACAVGMVTAVEPDFDILDMGFDDYVVKPVSQLTLKELVNKLASLADYETSIQRFFRLSSKKAALEAAKTDIELANSKKYSRLVSDLEAIKKKSDQSLADFMITESFENLYSRV